MPGVHVTCTIGGNLQYLQRLSAVHETRTKKFACCACDLHHIGISARFCFIGWEGPRAGLRIDRRMFYRLEDFPVIGKVPCDRVER